MADQSSYSVPSQTRIGHIHLKVTDLEKALSFYRDILGLNVTQRMGDQAAFLSAGDYHHHIGLNTWYSEGTGPAPRRSAGLFHAAIVYPNRKELARVLKQLQQHEYPITGVADHGVSQAIYLNDPDGNGLELYWDRPESEWPYDSNGNLKMVTEPLELDDLLAELN
ncbi:MAG: VOC family protein [Bacteroidota bacterium]